MEYSLKLNGRQGALWIKNLLISKNPKVSYRKNENNDEFDLGNGLKITLYDNPFPPNHPVASYDTFNITYLELLRTNYEELLEHIEYENFMGS